ncbi:MAG: transposase [Planctomycetota bacterium]|jgi:hypothetical protein
MAQRCHRNEDKYRTQASTDGQKNAYRLRRQVQQLYFQGGYSKTAVTRLLDVSKGFVMTWTQSVNQDIEQDHRGWPPGQGRVWDESIRERVRCLHEWLRAHPKQFYTGASAIQQLYRKRYPRSNVPPLRTLGRMLKELGLSQPHRPKAKGAARYLCYPEHTVYETLGKRVLEADFIGKKYLTGRSEPVNFIGFSFKKAPKLRYFQRVEAQSTDAILAACQSFFKTFEYPDVMKVDNCQATIGTGAAKRCLSRFMVFLLKRKIIPVFAVPRKPFSQASIEGNNSVFSRKFWTTQRFASLRQIDTRLHWFNQASLDYTGYDTSKRKRRASQRHFTPKVYFIRQVQEDAPTGRGIIQILNAPVAIRKSYIGYFVLAEWNLNKQQLNILFEKDAQTKIIKSIAFAINPNSRYRFN